MRRSLSVIAVLILVQCAKRPAPPSESEPESPVVAEIVASEELILDLVPRLKAFGPGLFSEACAFTPLASEGDAEAAMGRLGISEKRWRTSAGRAQQRAPSLGDLLGSFANPEFAMATGRFEDGKRTVFATEIRLAARTRKASMDSRHAVRWKRTGNAWRIVEWSVIERLELSAPAPMFAEVLDAALPDPTARAAARMSEHRRILLESYFGRQPARVPASWGDNLFFPDSVNVHPAVSVVDVDANGYDDLYVCVRWGRNLLLRNLGDGTFEECAARYGIDVEGRSSVALFADFDNDGDPDLFLGRSLEQSQYFLNDGGRYVAQPDPVSNGRLPWLVTSACAADFNRDGLLDIYVCTYSPLDINARITGRAAEMTPQWARRYLPPGQAAEVTRRLEDEHRYLNQTGPPDLLLANRGGRFEIVDAPVIAGYRNSLQAAWNDSDGDGDPDLYVANDFAPDAYYRNDGEGGFEECAEAAGFDAMGFGMGVSWGDWDGDGFDDLYVSNMYSKAGRRITAQVEALDGRLAASAGGNYLYRASGDGTYERLSGADGKPVPVHDAGWSWGGQFCDFDNDGWLDLYVSSGFYTPPPENAVGVDL